jgi:hypothetical protein
MQRGEEFDLEIWAKQWSIETDTIFWFHRFNGFARVQYLPRKLAERGQNGTCRRSNCLFWKEKGINLEIMIRDWIENKTTKTRWKVAISPGKSVRIQYS